MLTLGRLDSHAVGGSWKTAYRKLKQRDFQLMLQLGIL
jgi:hypothetical protein